MRQGIVYRLFSEIDDEDYVGSTWKTTTQRLCTHNCHYNALIRKEKHVARALEHFGNIGWNNVKFEILEDKEFEDMEARLWRERYWIETRDPTLNTMRRPIITEEERKELNRERNRKKRADPEYKEFMKTYNQEYREKNKEELKEKKKAYAEENKERIKEYHATDEYKTRKNEKRRNTTTHCDICDCDVAGDTSAFQRHCLSKKHTANLPDDEIDTDAQAKYYEKKHQANKRYWERKSQASE